MGFASFDTRQKGRICSGLLQNLLPAAGFCACDDKSVAAQVSCGFYRNVAPAGGAYTSFIFLRHQLYGFCALRQEGRVCSGLLPATSAGFSAFDDKPVMPGAAELLLRIVLLRPPDSVTSGATELLLQMVLLQMAPEGNAGSCGPLEESMGGSISPALSCGVSTPATSTA